MGDDGSARPGPCLDDDTLQALVEGRMAPGPALEAANQHLDGCASCLDVLSALMRVDAPTPVKVPTVRPASAPGAVTPGQVLGRYLVGEPLGRGAMGEVYAAHDTKLRRTVALKLLRKEAARSAGAEQLHARMWREAQALAQLSHPNLLAVYDVVAFGERIAIAMEYVDGGSARAWVRAAPRTWREVLGVYLQAGAGLAAAHRAGVVHRDFKPDNVLVSSDGRVRVSDFGLAVTSKGDGGPLSDGEVSSRAVEDVELTATGEVLGTPAYMASDQLHGAPATPASDQFSFAVSLWEALHGERPFAGATREDLARAVRTRQVRRAPRGTEVPASVRRVILRALSPKPEERHASMEVMLAALERAARWTGGRKAGVAMGAVLGIAIFATLLRGPPPRACPPPEPMLAGIWDRPQHRAVHEALLASTSTRSAELEAQVDATLGRYLDTWHEVYRTSCREIVLERRRPERAFFDRLRCLQHAADTARARVEGIATGGRDAEARAARLELELEPPEACAKGR